MKRPLVIGLSVAGTVAAFVATVAVVRVAGRQREQPARCPEGLVALGARCCGGGQQLAAGRCTGRPSSCGPHMHAAAGVHPGCVADEERVAIPGGRLVLGPSDWEAQGVVKPRTIIAKAFALDAAEVTVERWQPCVAAGTCPAAESTEPGRPITNVAPADAERFCHFVGGRLPTGDEWLFAAAGSAARRFPWGSTGLVCRRAAFGLLAGPCAQDAHGPDLAGARPDGATPDGILDLSGNAAEWTAEPGGGTAARGGSYRSRVAAELTTWAAVTTGSPEPDIGFRCAYTAP